MRKCIIIELGGGIMTKSRSLLLAGLTALTIYFSLYFGIIVQRVSEADTQVLLAYGLVALIGFAHSLFMGYNKIKYAPYVFLGVALVAGIYLVTQMPPTAEGFGQLGIILEWMIVMGIGFGLTLLYSIIILIKRYNKKKA